MEQPTPLPITPEQLTSAMTYDTYLTLAHDLFENHQRTTTTDPHYNTEEILGFTKLNFARIRRLEKTTELTDDVRAALANVPTRWVWLVLAESWCGDVAQTLPVMKHIADFSGKIDLRLLLRDENPDIMDTYLTNGGRSIPKLICLEANTLRELGTWGPRPQVLQAEMNAWKTEGIAWQAVIERAHGWYAKDHTARTQAELVALIRAWAIS
jgi:hypothetical protein